MNYLFTREFDNVAREAYEAMVEKGFYANGKGQNLAEKIALIHSEASELLESYRAKPEDPAHSQQPSKKQIRLPIPGGDRLMTNEEEELADIVLRVMDLAAFRGVELGAAIEAKRAYNTKRPSMHGKAF